MRSAGTLLDLLKLDLEGYERLLLRRENGWLSRVGAIIGNSTGIMPWQISALAPAFRVSSQ